MNQKGIVNKLNRMPSNPRIRSFEKKAFSVKRVPKQQPLAAKVFPRSCSDLFSILVQALWILWRGWMNQILLHSASSVSGKYFLDILWSLSTFRTDNILVDSGMSERIWNCIMNGEFVLKPGLDISSDVGAQHDVMNVLKSFCPNYLRLVLEAVFNTRIVCASESAFTEQLTALAKTNIFTSPEIVKNKAYVFTRGRFARCLPEINVCLQALGWRRRERRRSRSISFMSSVWFSTWWKNVCESMWFQIRIKCSNKGLNLKWVDRSFDMIAAFSV